MYSKATGIYQGLFPHTWYIANYRCTAVVQHPGCAPCGCTAVVCPLGVHQVCPPTPHTPPTHTHTPYPTHAARTHIPCIAGTGTGSRVGGRAAKWGGGQAAGAGAPCLLGLASGGRGLGVGHWNRLYSKMIQWKRSFLALGLIFQSGPKWAPKDTEQPIWQPTCIRKAMCCQIGIWGARTAILNGCRPGLTVTPFSMPSKCPLQF